MKDFDLRDLDAFVAVARTRNFRRAAIEQGVTALAGATKTDTANATGTGVNARAYSSFPRK